MTIDLKPESDSPVGKIEVQEEQGAETLSGSGSRSILKPLEFSSRAVKLRLFALVCGVMLVLVLMFEARKPQNWSWMGFKKAEPSIDTRYLANIYNQQDAEPKKVESKPLQNGGNSKLSGSGNSESKTDLSQTTEDPFDTPEFVVAEKDFWDSNYRRLNFRQRMLLFEGLHLKRNDLTLSEHQATEWLRMSEEFSRANDRYQGDIIKYMASLSEKDPERGQLSQTMFQMQERWDVFKIIFEAIGNPGDSVDIDNQALGDLQKVIDRTALGFVEDNSLQSFDNDQPAMFRVIERVQLEKPSQSQSSEDVLFSQLYKETGRLRGQLVSFEGKIRGAYHSKPTPNYLGVDKLFVYWIQIDGAQNPVAVYSLTQPENFPADLDKHTPANPAELREDVEVSGLLFQKMVYAAEDGQRIAPVVFTDAPNWIPKKDKKASEAELPGLTNMVGTFLGIGALLAVVAWGFASLNSKKHRERIQKLQEKFGEVSDSERDAFTE